jgi:hypothetical protein
MIRDIGQEDDPFAVLRHSKRDLRKGCREPLTAKRIQGNWCLLLFGRPFYGEDAS